MSPYSCRFACFNCRKAFKAAGAYTMWAALAHDHCCRDGATKKCPQCSGTMVDLGQDFHPPRKNSKNQWKKVEVLFSKGITFHSCGCTGPGHRPKTFSEAKRWPDKTG